MSGAHRRPEGTSLAIWLKSIGGLAALALAILLPLALLALLGGVIYVAVAYPAVDPFILIAALGVFWIRAAIDVATMLRRESVPGPRRRLDRAEAVGWILVSTLLLLSAIGREHGLLGGVTKWLCGALVLLLPVYWLRGKGRLIAAMEKRAAMRQGHTA